MNRLLARARAGRARRLGARAGEAGFTVVELMVAMLVMIICLAVSAEVVVAVTHQSSVGLAKGQAAGTSQVAIDGVAQYIEDAVTPLQAFEANAATDGYMQGETGSYCWGGATPGVAPASQLVGSDATGSVTVPSGVYGSTTPTVVDPSALSIVYAHDYDLELCAYTPGTTTPAVFEMYMPYHSCTSTTGADPVGDCTLYVVRYQPFYVPSVDYASYSRGSSYPNNSIFSTVVDEVHNIWCDQGCLDALPCMPTYCPPTHTNGSCWSQLTANQALGNSSYPLTGACAGVSSANESQDTPPLFTYLGSSGGQSAANMAATNLDLNCVAASGSTCVPSTFSPTSNPICQASTSPASYVTSTDDTVCLTHFAFGAIELRMTVLGDANQASTSAPAPAVTPKVSVSRTITLANLINEAQP